MISTLPYSNMISTLTLCGPSTEYRADKVLLFYPQDLAYLCPCVGFLVQGFPDQVNSLGQTDIEGPLYLTQPLKLLPLQTALFG